MAAEHDPQTGLIGARALMAATTTAQDGPPWPKNTKRPPGGSARAGNAYIGGLWFEKAGQSVRRPCRRRPAAIGTPSARSPGGGRGPGGRISGRAEPRAISEKPCNCWRTLQLLADVKAH
jgi:hypothetical protein